MSDAPTQVAPGVHRLGNALVNCYLIEDGNGMTLVDGGLPGFRRQLNEYLRSRGRSVTDIDAVILTHAHSDHVGMVEGVARRRARARPRPRSDAEMAKTGKVHKRDGSMLPYLAPPRDLEAVPTSAAATAPPARPTSSRSRRSPTATSTSRAARASSPRPATPPATSSFHLPELGVLIAGDALCTYNVLTGKRGPQLLPKAFAADSLQMLASPRRHRAHRRRADALRPRRAVGASPAAAVARAREIGLT